MKFPQETPSDGDLYAGCHLRNSFKDNTCEEWEKQDWGEKEFQMLLASHPISNDLSWGQDAVELGYPTLVQIGGASKPKGGGIFSGKAATFGWGNIQRRDSAMTCQ